jgi:hypothetical protein
MRLMTKILRGGSSAPKIGNGSGSGSMKKTGPRVVRGPNHRNRTKTYLQNFQPLTEKEIQAKLSAFNAKASNTNRLIRNAQKYEQILTQFKTQVTENPNLIEQKVNLYSRRLLGSNPELITNVKDAKVQEDIEKYRAKLVANSQLNKNGVTERVNEFISKRKAKPNSRGSYENYLRTQKKSNAEINTIMSDYNKRRNQEKQSGVSSVITVPSVSPAATNFANLIPVASPAPSPDVVSLATPAPSPSPDVVSLALATPSTAVVSAPIPTHAVVSAPKPSPATVVPVPVSVSVPSPVSAPAPAPSPDVMPAATPATVVPVPATAPSSVKKTVAEPSIQEKLKLQNILANSGKNDEFGGMTGEQLFAKIPTRVLKDPEIYSVLFKNGNQIFKSIKDKSPEEIKEMQNTYTNTLGKITTSQAQLFENKIIAGHIRTPIQLTNADTPRLVEFLKNKANRIGGKNLISLIANGSLNETKLTKNELSKIFGVVQLGKNTVSISNLVSDKKNKEILKNALEQTIAIRIKEQNKEKFIEILQKNGAGKFINTEQIFEILKSDKNEKAKKSEIINLLPTQPSYDVYTNKQSKKVTKTLATTPRMSLEDAENLANIFTNLEPDEIKDAYSVYKIGKTKAQLLAENPKNRTTRQAEELTNNIAFLKRRDEQAKADRLNAIKSGVQWAVKADLEIKKAKKENEVEKAMDPEIARHLSVQKILQGSNLLNLLSRNKKKAILANSSKKTLTIDNINKILKKLKQIKEPNTETIIAINQIQNLFSSGNIDPNIDPNYKPEESHYSNLVP